MTGKPQPETAGSATPSAEPAAAEKRPGRKSQFPNRKKSTGARSTRSGRKSFRPPTPWPADAIERRAVAALIPYARNARRHRPSQVAEIAASIKEWGWTVPILIDERDAIIAGHGRVLAAERLAIDDVPVVIARGWTEQQKRAYRLADNEIAMHAQWDKTLLRVELKELRDQGVDLELMGFAAEDALVGGDDPNEGVPQALQLHPPLEYVLIMCADLAEWERLKVALNLTPVRRGGYRKGSPLDDVGTQRVVKAADVLPRLETVETGETAPIVREGHSGARRRAV
jgi:hypothetical protein